MNVLYVDDEELNITRFVYTTKDMDEVGSLKTFQNPLEALEYVKENTVDVAFLEIEMPELNGIKLAEKVLEIDKNIRIIFVTAYGQYALDAFGVNAIGYLMKPYSKESVKKELSKARRIKKEETHPVYIQTIPSFDIFINGELLKISRPKVKELLALLIDKNGSSVTPGEVISFLWEERPDDESTKVLCRMTAKRLKDLLTERKIDYILDFSGNQRAIKTDAFLCDYYEILKGNENYIKKYHGAYLSEYFWAEETNASLSDSLGIYE